MSKRHAEMEAIFGAVFGGIVLFCAFPESKNILNYMDGIVGETEV
jgi:hypothetical protein